MIDIGHTCDNVGYLRIDKVFEDQNMRCEFSDIVSRFVVSDWVELV